MKTYQIILLFIFLAFIIIYGNIMLPEKPIIVEYIDISLEITNYTFISVQKDNVYIKTELGKTIEGNIVIQNNEAKKEKIQLSIDGQLKDKNWIKIQPAEFNLNPSQSKKIDLIINIPYNAEGNYTGHLKITKKQ